MSNTDPRPPVWVGHVLMNTHTHGGREIGLGLEARTHCLDVARCLREQTPHEL